MSTWVDRLLALPCALLPQRYWESFNLPVANVATLSAFITLFTGFALGVRGYFGYLQLLRQTSQGVSIATIAELQLQGKLPETATVSAVPFNIAITAPIAFALFTPLGLLATYLVVSSVFRIGATYVDEPHGDALLTGIDSLARRWSGYRQRRSEQIARQRLEGVDAPDRLYEGTWAGLTGVTYVVVAARRKPDWTAGTWVIAGDQWFTLGEPFDRLTPNGLRTVYPLTLQTSTLDVLRKGVSYELPLLHEKQPIAKNH